MRARRGEKIQRTRKSTRDGRVPDAQEDPRRALTEEEAGWLAEQLGQSHQSQTPAAPTGSAAGPGARATPPIRAASDAAGNDDAHCEEATGETGEEATEETDEEATEETAPTATPPGDDPTPRAKDARKVLISFWRFG